MEYFYNDILEEPNLNTCDSAGNRISGVHHDVANSAMVDKTLEWCRWDEDSGILKMVFTNELSVEDKTILDSIIVNN